MTLAPLPVHAQKIEIHGIVQGVGFRPFIYRLARRHGLCGVVFNTAAGVFVHVEGPPGDIEAFFVAIEAEKPPLARITEIRKNPCRAANFPGFSIDASRGESDRQTLIPPDIATCDDCVRELFDPADRRYGYPFINCTNCGPRYTIMDDLPYDRSRTSMKHFSMCADCSSEYADPENRRFHAQPNACPVCGPRLRLCRPDSSGVACGDPVEKAAGLLAEGFILAVKGIGGFHLAADAENQQAVTALRRRKGREEKPFAVMSPDLAAIGRYARISPEDEALLKAPERPIVLLPKRIPNPLADGISPGSTENPYFGAMLPYSPLHHRLLAFGCTGLVMTSGNFSDAPIAVENDDAFLRLGNIADFFLVHDRPIYTRCDDSVVAGERGVGKPGAVLRRSRGYAPAPVLLKHRLPKILAVGGMLKNTICLTRNDAAFLSQHIGDLDNPRAFAFFRETVVGMKRMLDISEEIIAHDLHPGYMSTRFAGDIDGPAKLPVQHHHAHVAACMAENRLDGPVIGLAFDGTGLGADGRIWGGEVLASSLSGYTRAAHLAYAPMPGGDAAVKEPWRMGISRLFGAFGEGLRSLDLTFLETMDAGSIDITLQMIAGNINCPETSSMGRLFDAVATICGMCTRAAFEGQAAMALEAAALRDWDRVTDRDCYPFDIGDGRPRQICTAPMIAAIVRDLKENVSVSRISARFHRTVIRMFVDACSRIQKETGISRVVLTGGVFQNALLSAGFGEMLSRKGFAVYSHHLVPANDGGISLGQAAVAGAGFRLQAGRGIA